MLLKFCKWHQRGRFKPGRRDQRQAVAVADVTSIELVSRDHTERSGISCTDNEPENSHASGEDPILHGKDGNPTTVLGTEQCGTELCTEGSRKRSKEN